MINYMPVKVYTGLNILNKHKEIFKEFGSRCLIITSPNSGKASGALDDVTAILNGLNISYDIYNSIKQNPSVSSCIEAGNLASEYKADFIVGFLVWNEEFQGSL